MKTWVTSDTHFNHANIIKYTSRPFRNVEEMNEVLIANWNSVVAPTDTVYHLGDFAMGNAESLKQIVKRLNGRIILVMGNHDRYGANKFLSIGFAEVYKKVQIGNKLLTHKPVPLDQLPPNTKNYHGHTHGADTGLDSLFYRDLSCEATNYTPVELLD